MEILNKIGNIAKKNNIKAYVVGGAVRDTLLGRKDFGIDIIVEGDGIKFAKILQKEFGGLLRQHSKFGTASLTFTIKETTGKMPVPPSESLSNKTTIDIASCRKEEYHGIAKLPKVETRNQRNHRQDACATNVGAKRKSRLGGSVSLQEDLKRRDFTINTLALDIQTVTQPFRVDTEKLIDLFNGRKDMENKVIRVLHPKSFVDDPTRIFRALRFAGKLGFRLEPATKSLALESIKNGFIEKLTPKRIRDQIILILKELERQKILKLMHQFGILKHLELKLPEDKLFKKIDKNFFQHPEFNIQNLELRIWFVYLLGIIELKNPSEFLAFTRNERQKIERTRTILTHLSKLESAKKPSEVYKLLNHSGNEELLFICSAYPQLKSKILKFLKVYKKVKLSISGKDLSKLGIPKGPLYKKLLSATLQAKLDGKLHSKHEELEFVKGKFLRHKEHK